MSTHVHMYLSVSPKLCVSKVIVTIKGKSNIEPAWLVVRGFAKTAAFTDKFYT